MGVIRNKIWSDLWANKGRTLQVVLIIAVGAAAIGMIIGISSLVTPTIAVRWQATNPAMINLAVDPTLLVYNYTPYGALYWLVIITVLSIAPAISRPEGPPASACGIAWPMLNRLDIEIKPRCVAPRPQRRKTDETHHYYRRCACHPGRGGILRLSAIPGTG